MLSVVAFALNKVAEVCVVVREPPLSAIIPAVVTLPLLATVKLVELIRLVKAVPEKLIPLAIPPDRVIPFVICPEVSET